jgi:hypothetical protein
MTITSGQTATVADCSAWVNPMPGARDKPFQKIGDTEFRVVFDLFLIKKLYNGIIFKLSSYDKDFLGNIRSDFSEGVLVYDTLSSILPAEKAIKIPLASIQQLTLPTNFSNF